MSVTLASGETILPASGAQPKQLTATAVGAAVQILALSTNSGTVYVGGAGVTSATGFPLAAGAALGIDVSDSGRVYLAGTEGDKVRWLAVRP